MSSLYILGQEQHILSNDVLGHGFDVRYVDALDWTSSSKGPLIVSGNSLKTPSVSASEVNYHFVTNPYEFEQKLLSKNTSEQPYLAINTSAHYKPLREDGSDKLLFVYTTKEVSLHKSVLSSASQKPLDSAFVEDFRRLGRDITAFGFINRYGTHYAREVKNGGLFIRRNFINVNDFIYSPYDKAAFQKAVIKDLQDYHSGATDTTPFIDSKESTAFTQGGDEQEKSPVTWAQTVKNNPKPIDITLVPITHLLRSTALSNIEEKAEKLKLLEDIIENALMTINNRKPPLQESKYYKKFSLQFNQEITSIIKKSSGKEEERENTFTGDIFFGGFSKDEAMLRTAPIIEQGGLRLETLITDEKVLINKSVLITIKPDDIETGYVSIWDDTKKLFKGDGRNRLRVSGPPEAKTTYQQALRGTVTKQVAIETIDKDVYEIEYTLQLKKQPELISNFEATYNYILDSEVLAAVSNGDLKRLDSLFSRNGNVRAPGIIEAIIVNKHPDSLLNYVLDKGTIPTTQDLDLLFEKEHFNENKALILLERGAQPKNNMIYKAVAYKAAPVIYALFREGATAQNNDLTFALRTKYYPTIRALMSEPYDAFTATQNELLLAAQNNDEELAQKFVDLEATADASVLDLVLQQDNEKLTNVIIPITETSNETLVVAAKADNTELFSYFIKKNAKLENNEAANIAIENDNSKILDLALKNGGDASQSLLYAIVKDKKPAIKISLENKAEPDNVFAYAARKKDKELFNETLNTFGGSPKIALDQAVKNDVFEMVESVLTHKSEGINTTDVIALAVSNENLDIVKLLIKNKANPSAGISRAIETENIPITEYLIAQGAETKSPDLLKEAVRKENMQLSKLLVEQGNAKAEDAIIEATNTGNLKIIQYLLDKGAKAEDAFENSMETENESMILLLMGKIKIFTNTHIKTAARKGNIRVVQKLLEQNLNPTVALVNAVNYRQTKIIKLLLENGAVPEPSILKAAVRSNYFEEIEILLKFSDLTGNTRFANGEYPIHIISSSYEKDEDRKALDLLLAQGANINAQNSKGETALHTAAIVTKKDIDLIDLLLNNGADPNITCNNGATPVKNAIDKTIKSKLRKASKLSRD